MSFTVRAAGPADFPLLPAIEDRSDQLYLTLPQFVGLENEQNLSAEGYADLPAGNRVWLAETDGPVGFIYTFPMDASAYVGQLSTVPEAQGQGIGTALLETALQAAFADGFRGLVLTTYSDVPWNRPFYERRGFAVLDAVQMGSELTAHAARDRARWRKYGARCVMGRFYRGRFDRRRFDRGS